MVQDGCVRLGTLSSYRDLEAHGEAVGDQDENTRTIYSHDTHIKTDPSELNPLEKQMIEFTHPHPNIHLSGARIEIKNHYRELLAYCASRSFDLEVMKKMSGENVKAGNDAYDACVEIIDHVEFIHALCGFMEKEHRLKYKGHGDCFYRGRLVHYTQAHKTEAWNLKPNEYLYQDECRIVLTPPEGFEKQSLIVNIPGIKKYCRIHDVRA